MGNLLVRVDKQGNVKIDASNFSGEQCLEKTYALIQRLGGREAVESQKLKPEYQEQIINNNLDEVV